MNTRMKISKKANMKIASISAIIIFALAMLVGVTSTRADIDTCQLLLDSLRLQTEAVDISAKDRATLLSKVDEAKAKINQAKFCDALEKLNDFKAKVNELLNAPKPKVSQEDADSLVLLVNDAVACITELACNSGNDCGGTITCPAPVE
jgi:hypothetical protein